MRCVFWRKKAIDPVLILLCLSMFSQQLLGWPCFQRKKLEQIMAKVWPPGQTRDGRNLDPRSLIPNATSIGTWWTGCWFGTWLLWLSHHIGNVIIPTDEVIFFRGVGIPPTSEIWFESVDGCPCFFQTTPSSHKTKIHGSWFTFYACLAGSRYWIGIFWRSVWMDSWDAIWSECITSQPTGGFPIPFNMFKTFLRFWGSGSLDRSTWHIDPQSLQGALQVSQLVKLA